MLTGIIWWEFPSAEPTWAWPVGWLIAACSPAQKLLLCCCCSGEGWAAVSHGCCYPSSCSALLQHWVTLCVRQHPASRDLITLSKRSRTGGGPWFVWARPISRASDAVHHMELPKGTREAALIKSVNNSLRISCIRALGMVLSLQSWLPQMRRLHLSFWQANQGSVVSACEQHRRST